MGRAESLVTLSAAIDTGRVTSPMTPLPLRYGGMWKRLKVDQETLLPAEAHVCFLLLFRNDPTHLKTSGAQDHLTTQHGEDSRVSRRREPSRSAWW